MRYLTGVMILLVVSISCSRENPRTVAATPTGPSATASSPSILTGPIGGVSGKMDAIFPGRNDSFQFRNDLEPKYQNSLGRSATTTYVDREGEVVWIQEYLRYRVNGCDHATAMSRVLTQIDGGIAGGVCGSVPDGVVIFPSRADALQARRELETKYQSMGRGLSTTFVDIEGAVIWIQEYLRYRINGCDHATAVAKVFAQIDGGPVADVCLSACTLVVNPQSINIDSSPASGTFEVRPNRAGCSIPWTSASDSSWLSLTGDFSSGSGFTPGIPFTVGRNSSTASRVGKIRFTYSGGSVTFDVNQAGSPFAASFALTDPFRAGTAEVTECHIASTNTPCTLTASGNLPGGGAYTYQWSASYFYGTQKTVTQTGASNTFTINDACGGTGAQATGTLTDLTVVLTITDSLGNTLTIRSNEGSQRALALKLFTC